RIDAARSPPEQNDSGLLVDERVVARDPPARPMRVDSERRRGLLGVVPVPDWDMTTAREHADLRRSGWEGFERLGIEHRGVAVARKGRAAPAGYVAAVAAGGARFRGSEAVDHRGVGERVAQLFLYRLGQHGAAVADGYQGREIP